MLLALSSRRQEEIDMRPVDETQTTPKGSSCASYGTMSGDQTTSVLLNPEDWEKLQSHGKSEVHSQRSSSAPAGDRREVFNDGASGSQW
ncbi:hypothetical protein N7539_006570 [Penicillium diatomitis]|uniref:Uncharacterized protein n=1 Tax=Penicillium diatomitis TaxID=2819901 RepID=A0A9W9X2N1_9EURO|nr:uncharacterized protein N7539_006570 [Penicillium diatomitis]KAJ5480676.1 hypothetical protein N7539_006570 [Penicillium diatomitis]